MAASVYSGQYLGKRFTGKVAICTASTSGIGFAVAERLAQEGAKVVVCSRKQDNVDAAVKTLRDKNLEVSGIVCHQANKEERRRLIEFTIRAYAGIDLLFAGAGVNPHVGPILNITEKEWDKLFDVNVKSTFLMIRECVQHMIERGGGSIVLNSTVTALHPANIQRVGAYAVSKSVLTGLTKVLTPVLARNKIRINCVAPGPTMTKFLEGVYKTDYPDRKIPLSLMNRHSTLRRVADPAECAAAVAFFLSDDASYVTGEIMAVSGGFVVNKPAL